MKQKAYLFMNADETVFFSESISGFQKNIVTVQDSLYKMFDIDLRKNQNSCFS